MPLSSHIGGGDLANAWAQPNGDQPMESDLRAAFDALPAHIAILDETGVILVVNRAWRTFAETNGPLHCNVCEGANYLAVCDAVTGPDAEQTLAIAAELRNLITGQCSEFTTDYACDAPHEMRWFAMRATRLEGDGPVRILVAHENNTVQYQREQAVRRSERQYASIFHSSPLPIAISRVDGGEIIDVNDAFCELVGYVREELIGQTSVALGITSAGERARVLTARSQDHFVNIETTIRCKSGEARICLLSGDQFDVNGSKFLQTSLVDITEHKRAERRVRESEEKFAKVFEAIPAGIAISRKADGCFLDANPAYLQMVGFSRDELVGRRSIDLGIVSPESRAQIIDVINRQAMAIPFEVTLGTKDGNLLDAMTAILYTDFAGESCLLTMTVDITEQKRLREALRRSEERFSKLFYSSPAAMMLLRLSDGQFVDVNEAYTSIFGYTQDQLLGHSPVDLEMYSAQDRAMLLQGLQGGRIRNAELSVRNKAGETRTCLFSADVLDLPGGPFVLIGAIDISARKEAEMARAVLASIVESSQDAIVSIDLAGTIVSWNRSAERFYGHAAAKVIGTDLLRWLQPSHLVGIQPHIERIRRGETIQLPDLAWQMATGEEVTLSITLGPVLSEDGAVIGISSIARDITARVRAEAAVRESEIKYRDLYDHSPDMYMSGYPADHLIRDCNLTLAHALGYDRDELIGQSNQLIIEPASYAKMVKLAPEYVGVGHYENLEVQLRRKDGSIVDALMSAVMEPDPTGGSVLSRVTLHDITERKLMEDALRLANAELARAMRVKDEFLANVSHELRTPLNAILTFAETLLGEAFGPINERQVRALGNIETSGRHLLSLINDLLDLSKFEAGGLQLHRELVTVRDVCIASLIFVKEVATKKRISMTFDNADAPAQVFADSRRLKQMLVNLLGNAVKFTPQEGQVHLKVSADSANKIVYFAIQDSGPGISPENQNRLFLPFTQLDTTATAEGTGLGLALVKRLAEQHGGSVSVESTGIPGQGSRFTITLPMIELAGTKAAPEHPESTGAIDLDALIAPVAGATVLLVDDDEMTINVVSVFLARLDYEVTAVRMGGEGLARAQAEPPDLILMDMQLADMDGLQVIRTLRSDTRFVDTPIIAITARAMVGDRERCLQAGASHYMSKPLILAELAVLMKTLLGDR